jgi:CDP-6-deoxy-D-xylo-4-hexulose-3-dehydrase
MNYKYPLMKNIVTQFDKNAMIAFIQKTDRFTNGQMVKKFENEWNNWLGSKYSLFVSSGSTANFLLVAAVKELYGLKDGDNVIVPACTWMTNVAPIIQLGLNPIFVDIEMDTYGFNVDSLLKVENPESIKLVFISHLLGLRCPVERYKEIFPNAQFIEDICESHGITNDDGDKQGSDSLGATFSFYFGHHMTSVEGGMVSTNNEKLYDLMKMKRSHGMARESLYYEKHKQDNLDIRPEFLFITDGYNFRNTEINAVLASSQLKNLDNSIKIRQDNFDYFLSFMNSDRFYLPSNSKNNSSFCFPIVCKNKNDYNVLLEKFKSASIETRPIIGGNLLRHPFLKDNNIHVVGGDTNVDIVHNHGVYVGNNHMIGHDELSMLENIMENL